VETTPDGVAAISIYAFRYSEAGHIDFVTKVYLGTNDVCSLVVWQNELWLARLVAASGGTHRFHIIDEHSLPKQKQGGTFTLSSDDFARPQVFSVGGYLIVASNDNDLDTVGPSHNWDTAGILESAYLDMGHPGKAKRLNTLTVLLDGKCSSNSTYTIKYRFDDATSWTSAGTGTSTRKIQVEDIGGTFYQMQVRVELSGPADSDDIAVETLSVVYTIDL
jgi:hypothetical protein